MTDLLLLSMLVAIGNIGSRLAENSVLTDVFVSVRPESGRKNLSRARSSHARLLADPEILNLDLFADVGVVAIAPGTAERAPVDRTIPRRPVG